jgi:formate hydrogenlyase subunit 3/multisubunit Na+/H+ antiporter MnhD subunit
MSLRNFHLVFVTVCSLLFAFLTLWSFLLSDEKSTLTRTIGITGIAGLILMLAYGTYFLRKTRRLEN